MIEIKPDETIRIDVKLYPLEVIYRTSYKYTDKFYLWVSRHDDNFIDINIKRKKGTDENLIKEQFCNDLIDFATRWSVNKETSHIRDKLVSVGLGEALKK